MIRLVEWFAHSVARHPGRWSAGVGMLLLAASLAASRLGLHLQAGSFLPTGTAAAGSTPGAATADPPPILIILEGTRPVAPRVADLAFAPISDELSQLPGVREVRWKLRPEVQRYLEHDLPRQLLLHLAPEDLATLGRRLETDSIAAAIARVDQVTDAAGRRRAFDPLGLRGLLPPGFYPSEGAGVTVVEGRLAFGVPRAFLLVATLDPSADLAAERRVARAMENAVARWNVEPGAPGTTLTAVGAPLSILRAHDTLLSDIARTGIASALLVALVLAAGFRRLFAPVILLAPVLAGIVFTAAIAWVALGAVSLASWAFAGVLVGLGVDYGVHVAAHYWSAPAESSRGDALAAALGRPRRALWYAALTSAAAFWALRFIPYPVMAEIGWLGATGLLAMLLSTWLVLPVLLVRTRPCGWRGPTLPFPRWLGVAGARPWAVLALGGILAIPFVRFDADPISVMKRADPSMARLLTLDRRVGMALTPIVIVTKGSTESEALVRERLLAERLDALAPEAGVARVETLSRWLPSAEQQRHNLEAIAARPAAFSSARVGRALDRAIGGMHQPYPFLREQYVPALVQALGPPRELVTTTSLRDAGLGPELDRFIRFEDGTVQVITRVHLVRNAGDREGMRRFGEAATRAGIDTLPGVSMPDVAKLGTAELAQLRSGVMRAIAMAVLFVAIILWFAFGRVRLVATALLPTLAGVAGALVVLAVLRIPGDLLALAVLPILVGIGVDDGIVVADHLQEEGAGRVPREIGSAMILTSLAEIAGFAALALARFPGLPELALVGSAGLLAALGAALHLAPWIHGLTLSGGRWRGLDGAVSSPDAFPERGYHPAYPRIPGRTLRRDGPGGRHAPWPRG